MVELTPHGVYLLNGKTIVSDPAGMPSPDEARENTIAYGILRAHDVDGSKGKKMRIRFDAMASHLCDDQLPQLPLRSGRHHQ